MYSAAEFDSAALHYLLVLAHTLWQAPLWAALLWVGLRLLSTRYLEWRYALALLALAGVVGSPLLTASLMRTPPTRTIGNAAENAAVSNAAQPAAATETIPRAAAGEDEASNGPAALAAAATRPTAPASAASVEREPEDQGRVGWPTAVALIWICGATLMLVRRVRCLLAARALADGEPVENPAIVQLLEQVQRALGIHYIVRLVASEQVTTPVVIGALRPTLVLPVSLMTGLSPTELQAIFAHELAHIRRHDFLVNLVQLLVEAVLFFNPAVWWISRQVRREREACCDAMAVAVTQSPLRYAEMLAGCAERAQWKGWQSAGTPAAVAMVGSEPSGLLDRIERLLTPGYRPTQRVSRRACLIALLMAIAGVAILQRGSDVAVAFAAQLLSDHERVERVVKARETVHGDALAPDGTYTLAGRVRTSDGRPPQDVTVSLLEVRDNASRHSTKDLDNESFGYEVQTGKTWLILQAPNYATEIAGPFSGEPGTTVRVPDIELTPGFSSQIRVVDANGRPVVNAEVRLHVRVGSSGIQSATATTTAPSGTAHFEHLADFSYDASVKASGFESLSARDLRFEPGGEVVLTPKRAEPTSGVVFDRDGNPAAGVEVWQHKVERPGMGDYSSRQLAITDATGRFVLDQLRGDSTYTVFLRDGARVAQVISGVKAGQSDLRWRMLPEVSVRGRIVGVAPENLPKSIGYSNAVGESPRNRVTSRGPNKQVDAEGQFTIEHLSPGELTIEVADRSFRYDVPESRDDLVVDLSVPEATLAKRKVILTFASPEGPAPLRGSTTFHTDATGDEVATGAQVQPRRDEVPVEFDGPTVELEAFAPGTLYDYNREMIGFWFPDLRLEIPAGDEPFRATLDVLPAGAVTGRVLRADGTPVGDRGIDVSWRMQYRDDSGMKTEHPRSVRTNDRGEYFASPVILGAETVLKVSEGHNILFSEPFTLKADKPTAEIDLTLPATVEVEGVVVDDAGNPLPNVPIKLEFKHEHGSLGFSPATNTGGDGRFTFTDINAEVGEYSLVIESRRNFLPVIVPLRTDGRPIKVRLQPGRVVTGTVVDRDGEPVEGVEVYANPADYQISSGDPYMFEAETPTDANGRFRLSNLPDRRMRLRARPMYNLDDVVARPADEASAPDVTLQGQVPDWHRNRTIRP